MQQTHMKTGLQCNDDLPVWSASAIVSVKAGMFYLGHGQLTDDPKLSARYVCLAQADHPKVKSRCLSGLAVNSNAALKTGDKIVITPVTSKDGGATWDARNEIAVTLDGKDSKTAPDGHRRPSQRHDPRDGRWRTCGAAGRGSEGLRRHPQFHPVCVVGSRCESL